MPDTDTNSMYVCPDCSTEFNRTNDEIHCSDCAVNYSLCYCCQNNVISEDTKSVGNDVYCDACVHAYCLRCRYCNEITPRDSLTTTYGSADVCQSCLENHYTFCGQCEEYHRSTRIYTTYNSNETMCRDCYYEAEDTCNSCGGSFSAEQINDNEGQCRSCNGCYDDDDDDDESNNNVSLNPTSAVYEYSTKPDWPFYKMPYENTTYMGIELEIEANEDLESLLPVPNLNLKPNSYIWKHDGSLQNGAELVTAPMTHQYIKKNQNFRRMVKTLSKMATSHNNNRCGLHIHVSLPDNSQQRINFIKKNIILYICLSKFVKKFSRRDKFDYCAMYNDLQYWLESSEKYCALNKTRKTLEFRVYRGTLDYNSFRACLMLTQCQIDFVNLLPMSYFLNRYKQYKNIEPIMTNYPSSRYENKLGQNFLNFMIESNKYTHLIKYISDKNLTHLLTTYKDN